MGTWPVKVPDLSWVDWRRALEECLAASERNAAAHRLEERWSPEGLGLVSLSVRSAFELLLRATDWEAGDEVLFTALTIPDMPRIARLHGLLPVPLDIDPVSATPDPAAVTQRVGPRTRAVVHAHLFGGWSDPGLLVEAAHRHGLLFVEDCAQCYRGPGWTGHPEADVTLFSFGPWKTATALGGGLARVRDGRLRAQMRRLRDDDPLQGTADYLSTVLTCGAFKAASGEEPYGVFVDACRALGVDHRAWVHRWTRAYRGPGFERRIRRRPCGALLAMLERRLDEGARPVTRRVEPATVLLEAMGSDVLVPGRDLADHGWWMVPVMAEGRRTTLMTALLEEGFDSTLGRMAVVDSGADPAPRRMAGARRLHRSTVYVPFDPAIPSDELRRLGRLVRRTLAR